jgi:hypothetical protein
VGWCGRNIVAHGLAMRQIFTQLLQWRES